MTLSNLNFHLKLLTCSCKNIRHEHPYPGHASRYVRIQRMLDQHSSYPQVTMHIRSYYHAEQDKTVTTDPLPFTHKKRTRYVTTQRMLLYVMTVTCTFVEEVTFPWDDVTWDRQTRVAFSESSQ